MVLPIMYDVYSHWSFGWFCHFVMRFESLTWTGVYIPQEPQYQFLLYEIKIRWLIKIALVTLLQLFPKRWTNLNITWNKPNSDITRISSTWHVLCFSCAGIAYKYKLRKPFHDSRLMTSCEIRRIVARLVGFAREWCGSQNT